MPVHFCHLLFWLQLGAEKYPDLPKYTSKYPLLWYRYDTLPCILCGMGCFGSNNMHVSVITNLSNDDIKHSENN